MGELKREERLLLEAEVRALLSFGSTIEVERVADFVVRKLKAKQPRTNSPDRGKLEELVEAAVVLSEPVGERWVTEQGLDNIIALFDTEAIKREERKDILDRMTIALCANTEKQRLEGAVKLHNQLSKALEGE